MLMLMLLLAAAAAQSANHIFEADTILEARLLPALSNGHLGFVPYGDTVHISGLHSGPANDTRRTRIPNFGRVQYEFCGPFAQGAEPCRFSFDARRALFRTQSSHRDNQFDVELSTFAHRVYDHTLVNYVRITRTDRTNTSQPFAVRLLASAGPNSADVAERHEVFDEWDGVLLVNHTLVLREEPDFISMPTVYALVQRVPETVTLPAGQNEVTFAWIAAVGTVDRAVLANYEQAIALGADRLLSTHVTEWEKFWSQSGIEIEGNDELSRIIYSSLYTVAAAQLAPGRFETGVRPSIDNSPAGLGLPDFQGHTLWDSEIWVHPVVLLLDPDWGRELLQYRVDRHLAAADNARVLGQTGVQFPVRSGPGVGRELSTDAVLAATKAHITGNVAFAIRQQFFATLAGDWLRGPVCNVLLDTARFWDRRARLNAETRLFDLTAVTGPSEEARNVTNNAFTNVLAAYNLFFGEFASCYCDTPVSSAHDQSWYSVARSLALGHSTDPDFTPAFDGFVYGRPVYEADPTLLTYPLEYPLAVDTHTSNLRVYDDALNHKGPSQTYAVHNIIRLALGQTLALGEFERSYLPYVGAPFYAWHADTDDVTVAQPRVSAAAAFLQQILNGFAGIRLHEDRLELSRRALSARCSRLHVKGIRYLKGTYALDISPGTLLLTVVKRDVNTQIVTGSEVAPISQTKCEYAL